MILVSPAVTHPHIPDYVAAVTTSSRQHLPPSHRFDSKAWIRAATILRRS